MKVFLSELAESKLSQLLDYLLQNWDYKIQQKFLKKITDKINQIVKHPESCSQSAVQKGIFKCVVSKQTTFYYRINYQNQEIEIITFFDTRQNPDNLNPEIKLG